MRLIDICEFYSEHGGGVKTYVDQKLEAAANLGHTAIIVAPGPYDRREARRGGEVIWVKSPTLAPDPRYHIFWKKEPIHQVLDEFAPDVVEASSTWRGAWGAASWAGKAPKALFAHQDPVAVYPHTIFSPLLSEDRVDKMCFWFWNYFRKLSSRFDSVVVGGDWLAARFAHFGVKDPVSAPMGVDKTHFSHEHRSMATRKDMLAACGIDDADATLFIAVSRHHPEKRIKTMIKGFEAFAKDHKAGLYIVGDGPSRKLVERWAGATQNVYVAGVIRDRQKLARYLASADYFLHGGAAETFGLVVAEALASGLPLIAPSIGGAADLAHPTYAETYRAGDATALTQAIHRAHERDRNDLSIAARAGANRINSPADHFRVLFDHYAQLSEKKKREVAAA